MMRRDFLLGAAAGLVSCALPRPPGLTSSRTRLALAPGGVVHDGTSIGAFGLDPDRAYPDVRSFRKKLGLLLPATNTSMEHELWRIVFDNREALAGVGIHTTPVATPRPVLKSSSDLEAYKKSVEGLKVASVLWTWLSGWSRA